MIQEKYRAGTAEYFEELFHRTKRELQNAWEKNEEVCDNMGIPCYDSLNEYALISIFHDLFNFSQPVSVKFIIGKETGRYNMMQAQWDWLKSLGDGDPSKGLDKLVQMCKIKT